MRVEVLNRTSPKKNQGYPSRRSMRVHHHTHTTASQPQTYVCMLRGMHIAPCRGGGLLSELSSHEEINAIPYGLKAQQVCSRNPTITYSYWTPVWNDSMNYGMRQR